MRCRMPCRCKRDATALDSVCTPACKAEQQKNVELKRELAEAGRRHRWKGGSQASLQAKEAQRKAVADVATARDSQLGRK